jgi:DNA-binding IclR family transcriptional regulator
MQPAAPVEFRAMRIARLTTADGRRAGSSRRRSGMSESAPVRNQSLVRGAQLLTALSRRPAGVTVAELCRAVDLPRTTVARLLATLEDIGFVERSGATWSVGRELTRIGRAAQPFKLLIDVARPLLEQLAIEARESVVLQLINRNWEAEVIIQVDPPMLVGLTNWMERRFAGELHASAAGKLALAAVSDEEVVFRLPGRLPAYTPATITDMNSLFAELARVRRQGFAETVDELELGLTGNAVPIEDEALIDATGLRSLSIGISGVTSRLPRERREALLPAILACRDQIVATLAGTSRAPDQ